MIDVLKIYSKPLKFTAGKLTKALRIPISFDGSIGSRDGDRPLRRNMMKRYSSFVPAIAFTSRIYISQHIPMAASET